MITNIKNKNIFADKSSFIIRKMLMEPNRKWVLRDFTGREGVSLGLAQAILNVMCNKGYIEWNKQGAKSYFIFANKEALLTAWVQFYNINLNLIDTYYYTNIEHLYKSLSLFKPNKYALTLHSGANHITSYVKTDDIFIYLNILDWETELIEFKQRLELKELVKGGNFHVIKPYYKKSVFLNTQRINGLSIVSNLQLYLDLIHFKPRGKEHALYLQKMLVDKGIELA